MSDYWIAVLALFVVGLSVLVVGAFVHAAVTIREARVNREASAAYTDTVEAAHRRRCPAARLSDLDLTNPKDTP